MRTREDRTDGWMPLLPAADRQGVAELVAYIAELDEHASGIIGKILPRLRELLDTEITCGYRLRRHGRGGAEIDYCRLSGLDVPEATVIQHLDRFFERMAARRGIYDPLHPQREQRNLVLRLPWRAWCRGESSEEVARALAPGASVYGLKREAIPEAAETIWALESPLRQMRVRAYDQMRILLCEQHALLAWVGALQEAPFSDRQQQLLEGLAEPLRQRLVVERRAGRRGLGHAAMIAALEYVPSAAFVLDAKGAVVHANAVGRHRLEVSGAATRRALAAAIRGRPAATDVAVTKLVGRGLPTSYLAISGARGHRVLAGLEQARLRWSLTTREAEVLAELAAGRGNRDISDRLGVAQRTVEIHVSSILRKAHADSRSQLIIELWHLAGDT
jgi:DNA-binding CsgD family transcriptional regulator